MVQFRKGLAALAALVISDLAVAHPGHDATKELANHKRYMEQLKTRDLDRCQEKMWSSGLMSRMIERRRALVETLRRDAGFDRQALEARDIDEVLATNHHSDQDYTPETPDDIVFGTNRTANLAPEIIEGPYYVKGEIVREDVTEDEAGVPLTLDVLMIDHNTCEALSTEMLEIWSCNSTGVYGGVVSEGNGNPSDLSNIDNTALRGVQPTNEDGVATFKTIVPGHYVGRAVHIHVLSHIGATILPNKTLTGGTLSHVGQIYFDQDLVDSVEKLAPYNTNTQPITLNKNDTWMAQGAEGDDPVVNYVLLGENVSDGLFGWITLGMDPNAHRNITPAVILGENGGEKYSGPPIQERSAE